MELEQALAIANQLGLAQTGKHLSDRRAGDFYRGYPKQSLPQSPRLLPLPQPRLHRKLTGAKGWMCPFLGNIRHAIAGLAEMASSPMVRVRVAQDWQQQIQAIAQASGWKEAVLAALVSIQV